MSEPGRLPWEDERCRHREGDQRCIAASLDGDGACFVHATPELRQDALAALGKETDLKFTRGLQITNNVLSAILQHASKDHSGRPILRAADFSRATFTDIVDLNRVCFIDTVSFERARFEGAAFFGNTRFEAGAYFARVHFASNAFFVGAEFTELAVFEQVQFDHGAVFDTTVFSGDLSLYGSRFPDVAFRRTQFRGDTHLGPFFAMAQVNLSGAIFAKATTVEVVTRELVCYRTRFEGSTNLRVRNALIVLDSAWFGGPSTVSFAEAPFKRRVLDLDERPLFETELVAGIARRERPVLLSLRQVDAGPLVLSGLDLSSCYFNGAFNLDRLKIEGPRYFPLTPRGVRVGLGWPPVWRWTTRSVLADECAWRAAASLNPDDSAAPRSMTAKDGWNMPPAPDELSDDLAELGLDLGREGSLLGPDRIASLYRSLRKGYEDSKNEPGAADFYYGETEMRRLNAGTPRAERLLLFLYWLTSGYGLRGSRALLSLFFTIAIFAVALHQWGFTTPRPFVHALLFSAQSTTSLLRAPEESLTYMGEALQIALRLLGPLFFALTVLALRGRVRR